MWSTFEEQETVTVTNKASSSRKINDMSSKISGLEEITGNRDFIYVYSDSYVSQKSPALWQLAFEILEKSSLEYLDMKIDSFECENPDLSKTDYESGIEKIRAEHKRFIAELENARDMLVCAKNLNCQK